MNDESDEAADSEKRSVSITDDGVLDMIRTNDPAVKKLAVTCISHEDIFWLADALPETSTIKHLRIDLSPFVRYFQNTLGLDASAKLSASITRMPFLEHFEMECCEGSVETIRPIASALANAKALRVIVLSYCGIDSNEMVAISDSFGLNHSVDYLDLSNNNFGGDGAIALSSLIAKLSNLQFLTLHQNQVGAEGAATLTRALTKKESIHLNVTYNNIDDKGAAAMAGLLSSNTNIFQLSLSGNNISPVGCSDFARAIAENQYLQYLDLSDNLIGNAGVIALASLLATNNTIVSLNLGGNRIWKEGAEALARALAVNQTIEFLDIRQENEDDLLEEEEDEGEYDEIFVEGIYNYESMETILSSNHTLKALFPAGDDLRSTLALNEGGPEKAKRTKLVKLLNEKPTFVLSIGMEEKMVPMVLEKVNEFDAMFELLIDMPDLFKTARERQKPQCRKRSRSLH